MATWITDRTQADIDRVKELTAKARTGTWTTAEQQEWAAGMKGALSYTDYNRIESGISEIATAIGAPVTVKTDWSADGYLTSSDATRWLANISNIRSKCSGPGTEKTPSSMDKLTYKTMNAIEQVLVDVEKMANDHLLYCSEPICGGEFNYAYSL